MEKIRNSSVLLNKIIEVLGKQKGSKTGLGFVEICPPFFNEYSNNIFSGKAENFIKPSITE